MAYHNGYVVSVVEREGPVPPQEVLLGPQEHFQVVGVVPHELGDMVQAVILEERIHKQHLCLQENETFPEYYIFHSKWNKLEWPVKCQINGNLLYTCICMTIMQIISSSHCHLSIYRQPV